MRQDHARHCIRCGNHLAEGAAFCGSCGAAAVAVVAPVGAPPGPGVLGGGGGQVAPRELASNPQRTTAVIWLFIALGGGVGAVLPFVADIDIASGGGALVMVGILVAITGLVVSLTYFGRASTLNRILTKDRLVYWQYQPDEWARYTEAEHGRHTTGLRGLFLTIALISLVVGVGFLVVDPDAGKFVFLVLLGVVAICGLAAVFSSRSAHGRNRARVGDVYIAASGVYLNQVLHTWKGLGATLDRVGYVEGAPPCIEFVYSMPSRTGSQSETVRVPVPSGQEPVARGLAAQFQAGLEQA